MGRSNHRDDARYHEVLNRAVWSSREVVRVLLVLLLQRLDGGDGPLIFGIDKTLERRRAPKSGHGPSTVSRCGPTAINWSKQVACAGSP